MKHTCIMIVCLTIAFLCCLTAFTEGDLLGNGVNYTIIANQILYGGRCAQGTTANGGGIEVLATDQGTLPRLYTTGGKAVSGVYARAGESELFFTPASDTAPISLDFLMIDSGARMDVRFWDFIGEAGIHNTDNPSLVLAQKRTEDGDVVTCVTRSSLSGRSLTGEATLYRSVNGVFSLTGQGKNLTVTPPANSRVIGSVKWSYDTSTRKLTASALNADGHYTGISYDAFVSNVIQLNGTGVEKAAGTIKANSDKDEWRLRIVFPEAGVFQSPVYRMDGSVSKLADGKSYMTGLEPEVPTETPVPVETVAIQATPTPAPTPAPTPYVPMEPLIKIALPTGDAPYELSPEDTIEFVGEDVPGIRLTVDRLHFTVDVTAVPGGYRVSRIGFVQKATGGFGMNMMNGYSVPAPFVAENTDSTVSITVYLEASDGTTRTASGGSFTIKAK